LPISALRITRTPRPAHRPGHSRLPAPAVLSARVEKLYVAFVAFFLGVAGTGVGFAFGVVPYFRSSDFSQYDWFFASCVGVGAFAGFVVGVANGARWYRATEESPLIQRRMLAYLHRRGLDGRGVPQRTVTGATLRSLLGSRRTARS
jgi:hypothetical protein